MVYGTGKKSDGEDEDSISLDEAAKILMAGKSTRSPSPRRRGGSIIHCFIIITILSSAMASMNVCRSCARVLSRRPACAAPRSIPRRGLITSAASRQPASKPRPSQPTTLRQASTNTAEAAPDNKRTLYDDFEPPQSVRRTTPLSSDNLFHSFTKSPSPIIRQRAAVMRQNAYCSHPDHQATRIALSPTDLESRKIGKRPPAHVRYECPDCGIPVSCSEEHFVDDYEQHLEICDTLRQINEDDHDLISGRFFREFEYPGPQLEEAMVNLTNWDTMLYSREFQAVDDERAMRQVTRLLTYPVTIGSVLHELSPYSLKKGERLTPEGLRSLSALRYTLHPPRRGEGMDIKGLRPNPPPVRLFILGARAESSLPREVWLQLVHLFHRVTFHLIFIGPESMTGRDNEFPLPERTPSNPFGAVVEDRLGGRAKVSTIVDYYHTIHKTQYFAPYDPYFDAFVLFHPGLGHPASSHEWQETLPQLLETKVPIICTGYTQFDMERDIDWVKKQAGGEMDILLEPGENRFRSLRWDLNDLDPSDVSCGNWGVWAFRGKRYETDTYNQAQ